MTVEATIPASMPDAIDCAVPSLCVTGSSKNDRMLSNITNRIASLPIEP